VNAITIHKDHLEILSDYSDGELGLLLRSLIADVLDGEAVKLPPDLAVIRKYINNQNIRFSKQQAEKRKPNESKEPPYPYPVTDTVFY